MFFTILVVDFHITIDKELVGYALQNIEALAESESPDVIDM